MYGSIKIIATLAFVFLPAPAFSVGVKLKFPEGWKANKDYLGMEWVVYSPFKLNRAQPVLFVSHFNGSYSAEKALEALKSEDNSPAVLRESGFIKSKNTKIAFIKLEIVKKNEVFYELMAIIPGQTKYHSVTFSAPKDYFSDYEKQVRAMLQKSETY